MGIQVRVCTDKGCQDKVAWELQVRVPKPAQVEVKKFIGMFDRNLTCTWPTCHVVGGSNGEQCYVMRRCETTS
jgi:hypothetical protein